MKSSSSDLFRGLFYMEEIFNVVDATIHNLLE